MSCTDCCKINFPKGNGICNVCSKNTFSPSLTLCSSCSKSKGICNFCFKTFKRMTMRHKSNICRFAPCKLCGEQSINVACSDCCQQKGVCHICGHPHD